MTSLYRSSSRSIPLTAITTIYTLSLHDALPIYSRNAPPTPLARAHRRDHRRRRDSHVDPHHGYRDGGDDPAGELSDRKSTRLNSSHLGISYAVFCLEKKKILRSVVGQ